MCTIQMIVKGDVKVDCGRRTGCLWETHSLIMTDGLVYILLTLCKLCSIPIKIEGRGSAQISDFVNEKSTVYD
jgi:hypothetical protein